MNKNTWEKLPENLKKLFNEYPFEEKLATMWNEIDVEGKQSGVEKGMEFIQITKEEMPNWQKAVEPVVQKYINNMTSQGFKEQELKEAIDFIKERIKFWTQKQKEAGIKSPTGPDEVRMK
jgi:TRAP-type C4-dicarboxylate transport system substrate-binding protein